MKPHLFVHFCAANHLFADCAHLAVAADLVKQISNNHLRARPGCQPRRGRPVGVSLCLEGFWRSGRYGPRERELLRARLGLMVTLCRPVEQ